MANYTITPTAGANGTISPSTPQTVASGGNVTFTITPAEGFVVDDVLVNGVSVGAMTTYEFTNVTANGTIAASFKTAPLVTHAVTATAGDNGTIAPAGEQTVTEGDDITFAITPAGGYYVDTLTVDGVLSSRPSPTRSPTCGESHHRGDVRDFARVLHHHSVCGWRDGRHARAGPPLWTLPTGGSITYYFVSDPGFHVDTVLVNDWPVAWDQDDDSFMFVAVDRNQTLSVEFAANMWTLEASATGSGAITPSGTQDVLEGSDVTYTFTPNAGNRSASVTVDDVYVGIPESYTFSDITENHKIVVKFVAESVNYTVTPSVAGGSGGLITPNFPFTVVSGGSVTFYFLPSDGYEVGTVTVDSTPVDRERRRLLHLRERHREPRYLCGVRACDDLHHHAERRQSWCDLTRHGTNRR